MGELMPYILKPNFKYGNALKNLTIFINTLANNYQHSDDPIPRNTIYNFLIMLIAYI